MNAFLLTSAASPHVGQWKDAESGSCSLLCSSLVGGGGVGSYELGVGCFGGVIGGVVESLVGGRSYPGCLDEKAVG